MARIRLTNTQTLDLLNTLRNSATEQFKERIPEATQETLQEWAVGLKQYRDTYNEFIGLLVMIGRVIIKGQSFNNPLAFFKKGELPVGGKIEEIFVDIARSEGSFDEKGLNPLGRRAQDAECLFYQINRRDKYVKSISRPQIINAFNSIDKVGNFIAKQLNSMYAGSEYDEYLCYLNLLGLYAPFYQDYAVPEANGEANLKTIVKTMRKAYQDLQFMSREHNAYGVMRKSEPGSIFLFIRKDLRADLDVDVLASAFNMDKTTLMGRIIPVENFGKADTIDGIGSMKGTVAVMIDEEALMCYDQLNEMATILNPDGLFENYFLHIWQLIAMSKFENAIRFTTAPHTLVNLESTKIFTANIENANGPAIDGNVLPLLAGENNVNIVTKETLTKAETTTSGVTAALTAQPGGYKLNIKGVVASEKPIVITLS